MDASLDRQYAAATLILRDGDRAQDAVQEALVSAWRDLRSLRDPSAWDAWLYRLTVRATEDGLAVLAWEGVVFPGSLPPDR